MTPPLENIHTAFVTVADAKSAVELTLREGKVVSESDRIVEAAWLGPPIPGRLWRRVLRGFGTTADAGLQLPFDADGNDVLGLMKSTSEFRPDGETVGAWRGVVRRAHGTSGSARADSGDVVLRDVWVVHPYDWRATELRDFELLGGDGQRVAIRCTKAPIVIAPASAMRVGDAGRTLQPSTLECIRKRTTYREDDAATVVELRSGDTVDVLGIEYAAEWKAAESARGQNYRASAGTSVHVAGDLPEVRLVIQRVG